jgi:hypothetical protein
MQSRIMTAIGALLVVGLVAPVPGVAGSPRSGEIELTKDCTNFSLKAGGHCNITASNFAGIPAGSHVNYDQGPYVPDSGDYPAGLIDSDVVVSDGTSGNAAIGHCTFDNGTSLGLCTFTDGTGDLAGFTARVNVSAGSAPLVYSLTGTYRFVHVQE